MKIEDAILTIKTFFLEILGFLIPGFFFICILTNCISENFENNIFGLIKGNYANYIILIVSYVTGYFLFGVFEIKKAIFNLLNKPIVFSNFGVFSAQKVEAKLASEIPKSPEFKLSYNLLIKHLSISESELPCTNYRIIRNIMMSYLPNIDNKIHTHMFRAELSKNIASSLQLVGILGLLSIVYEKLTTHDAPLKNDYYFIAIYFIYILIALPFNKTYERFYGIAMRIVFSHFIATFQPLTNDEKKV